ncbi:receptor-like protein EIX1 [Phaseolus vulgaris]|uniref:receptor-like protein EIX1 n=1 Tax=Phaseolus vulgaris TaxID=3885 RepID=UPI0035CBF4A9
MFIMFGTKLNLKILVLCAIILTNMCLQVQCSNMVKCMEREKQALLIFKQGLIDESNVLFSWETEQDCCKWRGVTCSNETGHVIKLDLQFWVQTEQPLIGEINPSLLQLQNLQYLDLSYNIFGENGIPNFIGSFTQLRDLKLSGIGLEGAVPHQLGNLSNLNTLDLSWNIGINTNDLSWISGLSSLRYLDLSLLNLSNAVNWLESVSRLPSVVELHLEGCELPDVNPKSLSHFNFSTSLEVLDLSSNKLSSSIFTWVGNVGGGSLMDLRLDRNHLRGQIPNVFAHMSSLEILVLSENELEGPIPNSFQNLCKLKELYLFSNTLVCQVKDLMDKLSCAKNTLELLQLSNNSFAGPFPDIAKFTSLKTFEANSNKLNGTLPKSLRTLPHLSSFDLSFNLLSGPLPDFSGVSSLQILSLSHNKINGILPKGIGNLSNLRLLDLSSNSLKGIVSEYQLSNLYDLQTLDVSGNSFTFNLSLNWIPPFKLQYLKMSWCKLGTNFPRWLQTQKNLSILDMSNVRISEEIPGWFWNLTKLQYLNLSNNLISGVLPNLSSKAYVLPQFDLSSNQLYGPLPAFPPSTNMLILSRNNLSGPVSSLCSTLSGNLAYLDLSHNKLSGALPNCWKQAQGLLMLNLAHNNFSGEIPNSIGALKQVLYLHMNNNNFLGGLFFLKNFTELVVLDLGNNRFSGEMPNWVGEALTKLVILRLRSNELYGSIPLSLCHLSYLQVLDVSGNNLHGAIPYCFNNLTALSHKHGSTDLFYFGTSYNLLDLNIIDFVQLIIKGIEIEYGTNLRFMRSIDISSNGLSGDIPSNITSLVELVSLNLSRNNLIGKVPDEIGRLAMLESLDLSRNNLVGEIPTSLSDLSFLAHLNVSFNNLSGRIPLGTQLQSFDASAYIANKGLCGPPLTKDCQGDEGSTNHTFPRDNQNIDAEGDESGFISLGFYASLGTGFITGLWGVFVCFLINVSWRNAYFRFLNEVSDWIHVRAALFRKRIRERWQAKE